MYIQRNVEIIDNVLMRDIDTGFVYLNVDRRLETNEEGIERIIAGYQFRLELPVDFDAVFQSLPNEVAISLQSDIDNAITGSNLRSNDIDATINKLAESSVITPIVQLTVEPRTAESDNAVEKLINRGTVIITNQ